MTSTNIESVGDGLNLNCSAVVENQRTELLVLPNLVIKNILRNCDLHTLKKLRLVSKSTKEWVEQTEFLQKFKIHITSDKISDSTEVPWNNFVMTWDTYEWCNRLKEINSKFAGKFGPFVKHLVINNGTWIDPSHDIFCSLIANTTIETLCIKDLGLEMDGMSQREAIWTRNLRNLKKLKIEKSSFNPCRNASEHRITEAKMLFGMILQSSPNLTHLHLPTLRFFDKNDYVKSIELHYRIVLLPLLNYLNRFTNSETHLNLSIDLDGFKEDRDRKIFPISPEGLLELSKLCKKIGAKLHNVSSQAFTNRTSVSQVDNNIFEEVISSVKILNDPSGLHGIYLPLRPKVIVEICADAKANYSLFELQEPIHSIHFSSNYFPIQENLYSNLFQVVRPSVQEFKCDWNMEWKFGQGDLQTFWTGVDISTSFPNLKSLHLEKWWYGHEGSDFNVLFTGLPLLERLCLKNCFLDEDGLLDNPFIVGLQNLVHLEFIDTHITDLHIREAFRHMRLKTFVMKCGRTRHIEGDHSSKVTFKTGISTLCSIDGGFGDTIEHFDIYIPNDCTKEVIDVYVNQFKNLKTYKTCRPCRRDKLRRCTYPKV